MTSLELAAAGVPLDPGGLDPFPVATPSPSDFAPLEFSAITTPSGDIGAGGLPPDIPGITGGAFLQDAAGNIFNPDGTLALSAAEAASAGFLPSPPPVAPSVPTADILRGPSGPGSFPAVGGTQDFRVPTGSSQNQPGFLQQADKALGLDTATGRLLASLGLGAAGIGLAQLLTPSPQGITIPQPPQTPGQQALSDLFANNPAAARALQEAILRSLQSGVTSADVLGQELTRVLAANNVEEPTRSAIRNASLQELLAMQQGLPPTDPVTAALRRQLLSITAEGTTNPVLERQFREQRDVLQNRMFRAEGPQWEMTTPGIDAATKLQESQAIQNYADWLNTIRTLTGPYQAGVSQAANQSTGLSQLGLPDVPRTVSAVTGIASPSNVGGITTTNQQAVNAQAAQDQAAILSALSTQRARLGLGQSIANLAGTATRNAFSLAA